jgi:nucleoid-associated protein YgaU
MIVGVGLVIAIAVVFFHRDAGQVGAEASTANAVQPAKTSPAPPRGIVRQVQARTAVRNSSTPVAGQRHTVVAGETLFSLAERYYKDEAKFVEIFRANRPVVRDPDALTPGTVLIIPDLP